MGGSARSVGAALGWGWIPEFLQCAPRVFWAFPVSSARRRCTDKTDKTPESRPAVPDACTLVRDLPTFVLESSTFVGLACTSVPAVCTFVGMSAAVPPGGKVAPMAREVLSVLSVPFRWPREN